MGGEIILKSLYINKKIDYDGTQLTSHWILENTQIYGDAIVAFEGKADVNLDHMVDLEDVLEKKHIYSENMLHFLIEHFDDHLELAIIKQRLLISIIKDEIEGLNKSISLIRDGDDLYQEGNKLSVSIATISPVSTLIHIGINISSCNTPVATVGLDDLNISVSGFSDIIMKRYINEMKSIKRARVKVKSVL